MNRHLLLIIGLLASPLTCATVDQEPETAAVQQDLVVHINQKRIEAIKQHIERLETKRMRALGLLSVAGAGGAAAAFWYMFIRKTPEDAHARELLQSLQGLSDLERRQFILALHAPADAISRPQQAQIQAVPERPWYARLWSYSRAQAGAARNYLRNLPSRTPGIMAATGVSLFAWYAKGQATTVMMRALPNVDKLADRFLATRSMSWFIQHQTEMDECVRMLMNHLRGYDSLTPKDQCGDKNIESLKISINLLTLQIEKILAFMMYVGKHIPEQKAVELAQIQPMINVVAGYANKISDRAEEVIRMAQADIAPGGEFLAEFVTDLIQLLQMCQNFKAVEVAGGFGDAEERGVFQRLFAIIDPQPAVDPQDMLAALGESDQLPPEVLAAMRAAHGGNAQVIDPEMMAVMQLAQQMNLDDNRGS